MMPKTETSGDGAAEEWSTPVNWEEDHAMKAERREQEIAKCHTETGYWKQLAVTKPTTTINAAFTHAGLTTSYPNEKLVKYFCVVKLTQ